MDSQIDSKTEERHKLKHFEFVFYDWKRVGKVHQASPLPTNKLMLFMCWELFEHCIKT
jgi:hypothetical protein